jgi:hypothetical protein
MDFFYSFPPPRFLRPGGERIAADIFDALKPHSASSGFLDEAVQQTCAARRLNLERRLGFSASRKSRLRTLFERGIKIEC